MNLHTHSIGEDDLKGHSQTRLRQNLQRVQGFRGFVDVDRELKPKDGFDPTSERGEREGPQILQCYSDVAPIYRRGRYQNGDSEGATPK